MASLETAKGEEKKVIMARFRKLGEEMKPLETKSESGEKERLDKELELHHATGEE